MKKTIHIFTFSLLMLTNSAQPCDDQQNYTHNSDYSYSNEDKNNIEFCRAILDYDIEELKNLIVPGQELAAVVALSPNTKATEFVKNSTFIHLLVAQLDLNITSTLSSQFNQDELSIYQSKILKLIKHAVSVGVDINAKDDCENTALMISLMTYNVEVTQFLINLGADLEIKRENGYTILPLIVTNHIERLYESAFIITFDSLETSEYYYNTIQTTFNIEVIKILLRAGADSSIEDENGCTISKALETMISEVNEAFEYFNFDKDMQSMTVWGFEIDLCKTSDFHTALTQLKQDLEVIKNILKDHQTL